MTMSNENVGKYIRLLCLQHQKGRLTERDMLYICSTYVEDVYLKFCIDAGGLYYNKRMEEESLKRRNYSNSRKANILHRYAPVDKAVDNLCMPVDKSPTYVVHMENANAIHASNTTIPNKAAFTTVFEDIWTKYPKRVGKKEALRHFLASVLDENDVNEITTALENYIKSERVSNGFIQNGSTWFNNWRDWTDYKESFCYKCRGKGKYTSSTGYEIICDCPRGKNP